MSCLLRVPLLVHLFTRVLCLFRLSFGPLHVESIYVENFPEELPSVPGGVLRQVRRGADLPEEVGPDVRWNLFIPKPVQRQKRVFT